MKKFKANFVFKCDERQAAALTRLFPRPCRAHVRRRKGDFWHDQDYTVVLTVRDEEKAQAIYNHLCTCLVCERTVRPQLRAALKERNLKMYGFAYYVG